MSQEAHSGGRRFGYRWIICALLVAAMTINYIDRLTLGLLKPDLAAELHWSEADYADMVFWFSAAYGVSYLFFGRLIDRIGARLGFALAVGIWTIGHMMHGMMSSVFGFCVARVVLGTGEGGAFPAGAKSVAEWFPKRERALALGIFNAGGNIGAIVTPLLIPAIVLAFGWRWAIIISGVLGLIWVPLWILVYRNPRQHPKVSSDELAYIEQDPADSVSSIGWGRLFRTRETWAYAAGKFLIDPIWWLYLYWLPDFLSKQYGLDLVSFGPPLIAIYLMSDFGSIAAGWMSSALLRRGWAVNKARKMTMLLCAILVIPIVFATQASSLWMAILIIGVATAAHQGFSVNLMTFNTDVFPRSAIGSVMGIGGLAGAIGGMIFAKFTGFVLGDLGTYTPIFAVAGGVYLLALLLLHLFSPRMDAAVVE